MRTEAGQNWTMHLADCRDVEVAAPFVLVTDPPYGVDLGQPHATRDNGGLVRTGHGRARQGHGLAHAAYASHDDSYETFVEDVVPRLTLWIERAVRSAVFTGPHIHEQRKPDAVGGIFCPAASARAAWGFKSILPILLYGKAPDLNRGSFPTAISSTETAEREGHPVPKPLGWMLWLVGLASRAGDTVVDPFAGSATTGIAAVRLGRRFVGIERDSHYFDLACDRLRAEQSGSTLKAQRAGQAALFAPSAPMPSPEGEK